MTDRCVSNNESGKVVQRDQNDAYYEEQGYSGVVITLHEGSIREFLHCQAPQNYLFLQDARTRLLCALCWSDALMRCHELGDLFAVFRDTTFSPTAKHV
jgi:hypothetical protein